MSYSIAPILESFPFVAEADARVLILGSMPGVESLRQQQYYAHPRNAFWPIMAELFGFDANLPYAQRLQALRSNRVALWDVAHRCVRPGSLDSDIEHASVEPNDFEALLQSHPDIRDICFNGRKACELFRRLVAPKLESVPERHLLPSTSPAHAAMRFSEKLTQWRLIRTLASRT
jgi:hypoxanthine-DNA glycosylase